MSESARDLIPSPKVVREKLARNLEEADLLRRLLRLAESASETRNAEHPREEQKGASNA
jgi:hypothetical protein